VTSTVPGWEMVISFLRRIRNTSTGGPATMGS
jgi:hypothetical protein